MKFLLPLLFFCASLAAVDPLHRIEDFLIIGDSNEALSELKGLIEKDPENRALKRLQIICLARAGNMPALLKAYKEINTPEDNDLLEEVAWAVIKKASQNSSHFIRQEATLAAFMVNNAKGIPICKQALNDVSEQARLFALMLASHCRDATMLEEAHRLMKEDSSHRVRLQAIQTVGNMRLDAAQESLHKILEHKESTQEEKIAAIDALNSILNSIDGNLIAELVKSERAIMRQLACVLVLERLDKSQIGHISSLCNDPAFDVRLAAIQTCGIVGVDIGEEAYHTLLQHSDLKTQILASWLSLIQGRDIDIAKSKMRQYLHHSERSVRLFAAFALAHAGSYGTPLAIQCLELHDDPLVRLNVAIGLIWQRECEKSACQALLIGLQTPTRLSEQRIGIFTGVGPSVSQHVGGYARLPESEDLLLRLELYGMLACCHTPNIKEPLKVFLKERTWGISGQTAGMMMQEGLIAFDELRECLQDANSEIALQAAFLLAILVQDEEALKVLEKAYPTASRHMKEYILYAIGRIGNRSALPFLVGVLNEPFESLRIIGARAILLSLNH